MLSLQTTSWGCPRRPNSSTARRTYRCIRWQLCGLKILSLVQYRHSCPNMHVEGFDIRSGVGPDLSRHLDDVVRTQLRRFVSIK